MLTSTQAKLCWVVIQAILGNFIPLLKFEMNFFGRPLIVATRVIAC
jgi:hypothetical protein